MSSIQDCTSTLQKAISDDFDRRFHDLIETHKPDAFTTEFTTFGHTITNVFRKNWVSMHMRKEWTRDMDTYRDMLRLQSMLVSLTKMKANALQLFVHRNPVALEKNATWTQWINVYLKPLSLRAPGAKPLETKLAENEIRFKFSNPKKRANADSRAQKKAACDAEVDNESMSFILNLLPHFAIDVLWLYKTHKPEMTWLHDDLREYCTRVHDRFLSRTWLDQSNVMCLLDQYRSPLLGKFHTFLLQKIAHMAVGREPKDFTPVKIRLPKIASRAILGKQLTELAIAASSVPLHEIRAHLKRMYESIGEEGKVDVKADTEVVKEDDSIKGAIAKNNDVVEEEEEEEEEEEKEEEENEDMQRSNKKQRIE